jgi:isoleucyl-tRNA synthetase
MSDAPQKQKSISEKEQETLAFWQENKIFEKSVNTPSGDAPKGSFSFYDGPPFATGLPHHGTLMAGTVKDVIPRYQTMKGNSVRRIWGWDCHGLPIENLIEKKLGLASKKDIEEYGIGKFNRDAYESVLQYEEEWKSIIPRVGRFVDMEHAYKTMDATYTESIWWAWKTLYEKELAYEGYKMMHICPRCETPLAQSEVGLEYHDVTDLSVTAKFELVDEPGTFVLAWTTTPWTLPGNTALALNQDAEYIKISVDSMEGLYIVAKERAEDMLKDMKFEVKETFEGRTLVGKSYKPVFPYFIDKEIENKENIWKIWHADFITLDTGTGIAHEAPAFGAEDMELAKHNAIPVIKHVKMDGTFTDDVTDFNGMKVKIKDDTQSADIEIIKYLAHAGLLFEKHKIIHSYPLCWRCKTPLLNYATSSWFVDVPKMKEKLLSENQKIGWTPEHIRDGRFGKWLEGAREWAVSRTRYWGAPLPVWKSADGEVKVLGSLRELAELNKYKQKNTYYVMRHGEAVSNTEEIIDCMNDPDNHLTETGKEETRKAAELLKDKGVNRIVISPFLRTRETAEIVADVLGIKDIVVDDRLRENNVGIYNGFKIDEYLRVLGRLDFLRFQTRPEGGETHQELQNRMMAALYAQEKEVEGKNILFIGHGGPIRMMIAGACLATEEQVIVDESREHTEMYLKNNEVRKFDVLFVPRDETGAVNLHRPYIDEVKLEINGTTFTRIPDVFDCWFESGSMPFAQLHYPFENKDTFEKNYPADFIAESMDQTRGWFYSLINLGVGLFDRAPYKHVICNGLINGADGQKISKSLGNYTDPMMLVDTYGADAFRYYLMSSPVIKGESINFKDTELADVSKKLIGRLENVLSLFEMNKPESFKADNASKDVLDIWIMSRLHEVVDASTKGYDSYTLDEATRPIDQFIDDLSVWYVRRARSRLKGDEGEEVTQRTFATLAYVLNVLARTIAPVMPFIAERVYRTVGGEKESVHLESWPEVGEINEEVIKDMKTVREAVSLALMTRNIENIPVRQPLATATVGGVKSAYFQILKEEINVEEIFEAKDSEESVTVMLDLAITPELQAKGDIRNLIRAVQDARKEKGLSQKDTAVLEISSKENLGDLSEIMKVCKLSSIKEIDLSGESDNWQVLLSFGVVDIRISKV